MWVSRFYRRSDEMWVSRFYLGFITQGLVGDLMRCGCLGFIKCQSELVSVSKLLKIMVARGGRSRSSMTSATFGRPAHRIEPPTRGFSKVTINF